MPLSFFGSVYLATFLTGAWLVAAAGLPLYQWAALVAAIVATAATILFSEHGAWRIGLAAPPSVAARELLLGAGFAVALIGACSVLVIASTDLRYAAGGGFPWAELLAVYVPAAVHEELLFRGYPYQKVRTVSRGGAIAFTSLLFAAAHGRASGITLLAMTNLLLAGVLLALAYEVYGRLWFPIGIHAAWNILSGPILGYNVSGYVSRTTVLELRGEGAPWLTGGEFGIEASVWMAVVEIVAIAVLMRRTWRRGMLNVEC